MSFSSAYALVLLPLPYRYYDDCSCDYYDGDCYGCYYGDDSYDDDFDYLLPPQLLLPLLLLQLLLLWVLLPLLLLLRQVPVRQQSALT